MQAQPKRDEWAINKQYLQHAHAIYSNVRDGNRQLADYYNSLTATAKEFVASNWGKECGDCCCTADGDNNTFPLK